jgi:hypothetical protein
LMMPSSGLIRLQGSFTCVRHPAWEVRISALTANVSNSSGKNCKTPDRPSVKASPWEDTYIPLSWSGIDRRGDSASISAHPL